MKMFAILLIVLLSCRKPNPAGPAAYKDPRDAWTGDYTTDGRIDINSGGTPGSLGGDPYIVKVKKGTGPKDTIYLENILDYKKTYFAILSDKFFSIPPQPLNSELISGTGHFDADSITFSIFVTGAVWTDSGKR
jgi:hypothetical protein